MTARRSATGKAVADLLTRAAESAGAKPDVDVNQWHTFVSSGFPWAAVPGNRGGPDGTVSDALDIVREIGRAAAPVPAGDTDLLGDWLLRQAKLPAVAELVSVGPGNASDDLRLQRDDGTAILTGTAKQVPWASRVSRFVALISEATENHVVCVPCERLTITSGQSLAGEPRDCVTAHDVALAPDEFGPVPTLDAVTLRARGAAIRTVLIQGAVESVVELVSSYCSTRKQFGRRLRDFQVVAHQLALLQEYVTLMNAAAELANATLQGSASWEDAATAKIIADDVATKVAKSAHQLHGAIGVSEEYPLQRYTRRLWAWRDEYGSESYWAEKLGATLVDRGSQALWPWMTESTDEAV